MGRKKNNRKRRQLEKLKQNVQESSGERLEDTPSNNSDMVLPSTSSTVIGKGMASPISSKEKCGEGPSFYAIYIPADSELTKFNDLPVFTDKIEALRVLKQNKKARLKAFASEEEAKHFAYNGGNKFFLENASCVEKVFYKGPKSQDSVKFRKAIENGDLNLVQKLIEENPRYLIGSGDTPAILQEGSRYNALHVAAKAYSAVMCSYILSVITSVDFVQRLYGANSCHEERINMLLDLYLNMPDKGCHETPLHFASKLGALDVVKVLVCYKQCDKTRCNKDGLTPCDIACTRAPENFMSNKEEIIRALGTMYYIPILRSDDNALLPSVGEPFTPMNPPEIVSPTKAIPSLEVKALAGPMTEDEAKMFRKMWKTPPRTPKDVLKYRPELCDPEKGLEKLGRKLAQEFNVEWKEYWSFLGCFVDITSQEGLNALDNFIKKAYESHLKESPIEVVGYASNEKINTITEHLNRISLEEKSKPEVSVLLDSHTLEVFKESKSICETNDNVDQRGKEFDPFELTLRSESPMFFEGYHHVFKRKKKAFKSITNSMEQACKIFANRIGSAILHGQKNVVIFDITSFQLFLASCLADRRFVDVDLSKSHYRLSALMKDHIFSISNENRHMALEILSELMSTNLEDVLIQDRIPLNNLKDALICIGQFSKALLSCMHVESMPSGASSDVLWTAADSCTCNIPSLKVPRRFPFPHISPRALFMTDDSDFPDDFPLRRLSSSSCSSSGSSDEYFTPPTSPIVEEESDSDCGDNEYMVLSDSGPDIFLNGGKPTKLDKAVLEAIEHIDISPFIYPYITLWKLSCDQWSKSEPIELWPTPKPVHRVGNQGRFS